MNKKNRNIFISIIIVIILAINLILIPYLHRRTVNRIVDEVLTHWKTGDFLLAYNLWETEDKSPPVNGLSSFKITNRLFDKNKGRRHALITADLQFTRDNLLPSGIWTFELSDTHIGWKITDFYQPSRRDEIE